MAEANSLEKLPPQNLEAEQSVLGGILIDKDAIVKVADILVPRDFYKENNGEIYQAMLDLFEKREPIDVVSLANVLGEKKSLERVGGRSYLISLANSVPTSAHIISYAKIVQKKALLRRLINASTETVEIAYRDTDDVQRVLDDAEQKLFKVSENYLKTDVIQIKDILTSTFERIDELHKGGGKLRGISTGFTCLDNLLAGLQKSDLIVLAARPGLGKTSLALDIARQVAVNQKIPVAIFSLEMSKEQLVDRVLCSQANLDLWRMRTGKLSSDPDNDEFERIGHAIGMLSEAPIFIDDTPLCDVMTIRTKARRLQMEHKLGLVIIDYLQLIESRGKSDNRVQEVSDITRTLKGVARELNVPVIALSQLSRAVESRPGNVPQLADLRESGSIEQDADIVIFIYREEMYKSDTERPNIAELHIKKHRNGPTGVIELYFDHEKVSFKNLEKKIEV